jgi:hypothetical protein
MVQGGDDPGRPSIQFGSKCAGDVTEVESNRTFPFAECTALATNAAGFSHLFVDITRLPSDVQRIYVSLVLEASSFAPGTYTHARAGSIDVSLGDGRAFRTHELETPGAFDLSIERAVPGASGDHFYVTGALTTGLSAIQNAPAQVRLRLEINKVQ